MVEVVSASAHSPMDIGPGLGLPVRWKVESARHSWREGRVTILDSNSRYAGDRYCSAADSEC